jgi:hypothetical protein
MKNDKDIVINSETMKHKGAYGVTFDKNEPIPVCEECGRPLYTIIKGPSLWERIFGNGIRKAR